MQAKSATADAAKHCRIIAPGKPAGKNAPNKFGG
jgi:hypothetical protein